MLSIEIIVLMLILLSIVNLISGIWLAPMLILYFLTCIQFFRSDSIIRSFPPGSAIQIDPTQERLIWFENEQQVSYSPDEIKFFITRWFILLKLGKGKSRVSKLLLSDSFADISHYTCFRRQFIEMHIC